MRNKREELQQKYYAFFNGLKRGGGGLLGDAKRQKRSV